MADPARVSRRDGATVALVLAVGICTALNMFTLAVLLDALFSEGPGLSENATQILTGWGGGIVGIIGAVVGYHTAASASNPKSAVDINGETVERS